MAGAGVAEKPREADDTRGKSRSSGEPRDSGEPKGSDESKGKPGGENDDSVLDAVRRSMGMSPRLLREAMALCGDDHRKMQAKYLEWKRKVIRDAEAEGAMNTQDVAEIFGTNTDYIAQLKTRRQITWTRVDGSRFIYTVDDVRTLFDNSEKWLIGGSSAVGGVGVKGPLAHLFVRWLRESVESGKNAGAERSA